MRLDALRPVRALALAVHLECSEPMADELRTLETGACFTLVAAPEYPGTWVLLPREPEQKPYACRCQNVSTREELFFWGHVLVRLCADVATDDPNNWSEVE